MSGDLMLELGLKSAALALITLLLLRVLKHRPAAERSFLAHLGLVAVLLIPLMVLVAPPLELELLAPEPSPPLVTDIEADTFVAIASRAPSTAAPVQAASFLYFLVALLLTTALLRALGRLRSLRTGSRQVTEQDWMEALTRIHLKRPTIRRPELLVSDEITSPMSWGLIRPVIVLDNDTLAATRLAEPVLLHELAHIRSLDWLKLVLERVVTALFWFNPLVWLLAKECRCIRERAADDAVLRGCVEPADYAWLLVQSARRDSNFKPILANGIAPNPGTLEERITKVLDKHLDRRPLSKAAIATSCALALATHAPVAAMQLTSPEVVVLASAPATVATAPVMIGATDRPAAARVSSQQGPSAATLVAAALAGLAEEPQQLIGQGGGVLERDPVTGKINWRPTTPAERVLLARAKADLEKVRPELEAARIELDRARPELAASLRALREAGPALDEDRIEIEKARASLLAAKAEIEGARPELEAAKQRLDRLREAMARGEPLDAYVAGPGETLEVKPNGDVVIHTAD